MAQSPILPPNRHIPYKKGGWGAAILTLSATAAAFLTAWYIHTKTYRHPRDLMMREVYEQHGTASHDAAQGAPAPQNGAAH